MTQRTMKILPMQERLKSLAIPINSQHPVSHTFQYPSSHATTSSSKSVGRNIRIPNQWSDKEYRDYFVEAWIEQTIGWQIKVNREKRNWSQKQLAENIGTKQSGISRLENADSRSYSMATLLKIASAFDCALDVRFIPFRKLAELATDNSPDALSVEPFQEKQTLKEVST